MIAFLAERRSTIGLRLVVLFGPVLAFSLPVCRVPGPGAGWSR